MAIWIFRCFWSAATKHTKIDDFNSTFVSFKLEFWVCEQRLLDEFQYQRESRAAHFEISSRYVLSENFFYFLRKLFKYVHLEVDLLIWCSCVAIMKDILMQKTISNDMSWIFPRFLFVIKGTCCIITLSVSNYLNSKNVQVLNHHLTTKRVLRHQKKLVLWNGTLAIKNIWTNLPLANTSHKSTIFFTWKEILDSEKKCWSLKVLQVKILNNLGYGETVNESLIGVPNISVNAILANFVNHSKKSNVEQLGQAWSNLYVH